VTDSIQVAMSSGVTFSGEKTVSSTLVRVLLL